MRSGQLDYLTDLEDAPRLQHRRHQQLVGAAAASRRRCSTRSTAAATPASCSSRRQGNGGSDGVGDNNDTIASYPSNYVCQSAQR